MLVHFKSNYVQITFLTLSVLQALHGYVIDYACKSNMNGLTQKLLIYVII